MVLAVSAQKTTRAKSPQVVSRSEVPEEGLEPTPTYVDWILNLTDRSTETAVSPTLGILPAKTLIANLRTSQQHGAV
jgi:hypothetical protein